MLQDLIRHELLAFDEGVGEVIKTAFSDDLLQLESLCLEKPKCHFTLSVLDGQSEAIFKVFVLF